MEYIELVIKISEEDYKSIKDDVKRFLSMPSHKVPVLYEAVNEGISLPKGHGKLGDLDALEEEVSSWGMNDYEPLDFVDVIDDADTIIPADKMESEG